MRNYHFSILLGLTTTVAALFTPLPAQAEPKIYQNVSGQENFRLSQEFLDAMESIGLTLAEVDTPSVPVEGYDFAYKFIPPSSDPNVRGSNSFFTYDAETDEYFSLPGSNEEFVGSLIFDVDQDKLVLGPQVEIGDFSVEFDETGEVSITDTITTRVSVSTIFVPPTFEPIVDLENKTLTYEGVDAIATQEFSDFFEAAGATTSIAGLTVAEGRLDRGFIEVSPTAVPETDVAPVILIGVGAAFALRKWRRSA